MALDPNIIANNIGEACYMVPSLLCGALILNAPRESKRVTVAFAGLIGLTFLAMSWLWYEVAQTRQQVRQAITTLQTIQRLEAKLDDLRDVQQQLSSFKAAYEPWLAGAVQQPRKR